MENVKKVARNIMLLLLLPAVALAYPIDSLEDFLFPEEISGNATITFYNFTYSGQNYSLVYVGGEPALFIRGSEIVESKSEIRDALWDNFSRTYSPGNYSALLQEIRDAAIALNESRGDGLGREEFGCRKALGENLPAPSDLERFQNNIYYYYSVYLCESDFGATLGCSDPSDYFSDVQSFFIASYDIDNRISTIISNTQIEDVKLIYPKMQEILDSLEEIENDVSTIKQNRFRLPKDDETQQVNIDECPPPTVDKPAEGCLQVCDELFVNETAISKIRDIAQNLSNLTKPLYDFDSIVDEVFLSIQDRIKYKENKDQAASYLSELNKTLAGWPTLKQRAESVLERVEDSKLEGWLSSVEELESNITAKVINSDFDGIDDLITRIKNLVSKVSNSTNTYEEKLQELDANKRKLDLLYLSVKDRLSLIEESNISQTKQSLDEKFYGKQSMDELVKSIEAYSNLTTSIENEIRGQSTSIFSLIYNGMVIYYDSLHSIVGQVEPFIARDFDSKLSFQRITPIVYSLLVGAAFSSVVVALSVHMFYAKKKRKIRERGPRIYYFLIVGFGAFLVFVVTTVAAFISYDIALNKATLIDFSEKAKDKGTLSIVLLSKDSSMEACASKIKESFLGNQTQQQQEPSNTTEALEGAPERKATIFVKTDEQCFIEGEEKALSECDTIEFPALILYVAPEPEVSGSSVGNSYLKVGLPTASYDECFIEDAFN